MNEVLRDEDGVRAQGVSCTPKKDSTSTESTSTTINYKAPLVVIADGCFSKFRKQYIDKPVATASHFVG